MNSQTIRNSLEVDDYTKLRRERGRQSQAAFRRRQTQAYQHLKNKNRQLIMSTRKILDNLQGNESAELLAAVLEMATTAGIDLTSPSDRCDEDSLKEDNIISHSAVNDLGLRYTEWTSYGVTYPEESQKRSQPGVWLDPLHFLNISLPPDDILPYLGAGAYTFAGRLFWFILEHSQGGCKSPHQEPNQFYQRILGHSQAMQGVRISFAQAMVAARLQYMHTGSIAPENAAAAEPDLSTVVYGNVRQDYQDKGKDPDLWMSCQDVGEHIQRLIGEDMLAMMLGTSFDDSGTTRVQGLAENLYCRLFDTFVCFGKGPRWTIEDVNELTFEWVTWASETSIV